MPREVTFLEVVSLTVLLVVFLALAGVVWLGLMEQQPPVIMQAWP